MSENNWPSPSAEKRFWANVVPEPNSGCWLWDGDNTGTGYGRLMIGGVRMKAHRFAAQVFLGARNEPDIKVCHKCDVPACCNPDHLFLGSQKDNMMDAWRKGRVKVPVLPVGNQRAVALAKETCSRGHLWSFENTRIRKNGRRECKQCALLSERKRYETQGSRWRQRSPETKQRKKELRYGK